MRTFNLRNYFGPTIKQKIGRPWYLSWKMAHSCLIWSTGLYAEKIIMLPGSCKQCSCSFKAAFHFFRRTWNPLAATVNSNVRLLLTMFNFRKENVKKRQPSEVICSQPRGRPTLLGLIDDMVHNYIRVSIFSFWF